MEYVINQSQGQAEARSLAQAIGEWLLSLKLQGRSPVTIEGYRRFISSFVAYIGADKPLHMVTPADIKGYMTGSLERGEQIYDHRYRTIRAFFNWCKRETYIMATPVTLMPPKLTQKTIDILTEEEIKRLLQAARDGITRKMRHRDEALVLAFYDTGARLGEMASLTLDDVDWDSGDVHITRGKGKAERKVSFSNVTLRALWTYLKEMRPPPKSLWCSEERRTLTTGGIQQIIKRLMKRAGITGKKRGPHIFRHTYACRFLDNGGSIEALKHLLGHKSWRMVERYSQATQQFRALKAARKFSPVEHDL